MRWGENLEFVAEAGPGDFIFVPPVSLCSSVSSLGSSGMGDELSERIVRGKMKVKKEPCVDVEH